MKIAVVGAGVSGLVCAHLLDHEHEVTLFEANDYAGGHVHTIRVEREQGMVDVDTGFIVFNRENYPGFCRLLERLEVSSQESEMSFSVRCDRTGLEYRGSSLNTLFAQRGNLLRPSFYRLISDIFRFFREAPELLDDPNDEVTLGDYLRRERYSEEFIQRHIVPMGAALWSATPERVEEFPAHFFVRFLDHHRMLQVRGRPVWRVVAGGSRRYVEALLSRFRGRLRLNTPVRSIRRLPERVQVRPASGEEESFDHVIVAVHSDQALGLLADPTEDERSCLRDLPYQENEAVLHTDEAVLPRSRRAWASWNYHIPAEPRDRVSVTYFMNRLQRLTARESYCVSLNPGDRIPEDRVIRRLTYHHPVFSTGGAAAQRRHGELLHANRTSFCGAYWGFGFHEDGVQSALRVCEPLGGRL